MHSIVAEAAEGCELLCFGERSDTQSIRRDGGAISKPNSEVDAVAATT